MRQVYETDEQREHEDEKRCEVEALLNDGCDDGIRVDKDGSLSAIDWVVAVEGRIVMRMEFKHRHNDKHAYPSYRVSANKHSCAMRCPVPVLILIEWDDVFEWAELSVPLRRVEGWGRRDRGDPDDVGEAVEIDLADFNPMDSLRERVMEAWRTR